MRTATLALMLITVISPSSSQAQDKNWKRDLTRALEEAYPKSKLATFEWNNVTKPGIILVVQKDNIMGESAHRSAFGISKVENGEVSSPTGLGSALVSSGSARALKVGDKAYVKDIDVRDDAIRFKLLTVDMYDMLEKGTTKRNRLIAVVDFKFPKPQLSLMPPDEVKQAIQTVLLPEELASAPKSIEIGQTFEEVEQTLGKPDAVVKLGDKTIYTYKNLKITFVNGKVVDVQ